MKLRTSIGQMLLVVVIGGLVFGAAVLSRRRGRRRARLACLARQRGFGFSAWDDARLVTRFREIGWMQSGYDLTLSDIVGGSTPRGTVHCFRYRRDRGFGSARRTERGTAAVLEIDSAAGAPSVLPDGPGDWLPMEAIVDTAGRWISLRIPGAESEPEYTRLLDAACRLAEGGP